jgi:hypothetical protein
MLIGAEELIASIWCRICLPFSTSGKTNLRLAWCGTVVFTTLADQSNNVPSFLLLVRLVRRILLRLQYDEVIRA